MLGLCRHFYASESCDFSAIYVRLQYSAQKEQHRNAIESERKMQAPAESQIANIVKYFAVYRPEFALLPPWVGKKYQTPSTRSHFSSR